MKILNLNFIIKIFGYGFAVAILVFTFIMLTKVLPYMTFERALNFLGTKPDSVLDKSHFIWAFYIHITSSLFVMGGGVFQFFPILIQKYPLLHRNIGKMYVFLHPHFSSSFGFGFSHLCQWRISSQSRIFIAMHRLVDSDVYGLARDYEQTL